jgi:hypothetical protein
VAPTPMGACQLVGMVHMGHMLPPAHMACPWARWGLAQLACTLRPLAVHPMVQYRRDRQGRWGATRLLPWASSPCHQLSSSLATQQASSSSSSSSSSSQAWVGLHLCLPHPPAATALLLLLLLRWC